ncbi:MAG: glycosyltransferase family 2 protein [Flavobacteriia bacterium]|nr:glycosyltransferase family 2 protein [Flavobacteriia bacterium]
MKITVAVITFNEEKNIARCLKSVMGIADEIIVMDSGSSDNTENICREFGATFYQQPWQGYAQQKNELNQRATYPMILSLDADEVLSPALQESILDLKNRYSEGVFSVNRLTNYCGTWIYHSGWYPDIKVRLFPKKCFWEGDLVHEELVYPSEMKAVLVAGHLEHYSYTSHRQHRERADRYSKLTAKKYVLSGRKPYLFQPLISAVGRFLKMYLIKRGFLDGAAGFHIARISAISNYVKYQEVKRLYDQRKAD